MSEAIRLSSHNIISHPDTDAENREPNDQFPNDRLLRNHLRGVKDRCSRGTSGEQRQFLEILAATHDLGKATSYFQSYIRGIESRSQKTSHAPISGLACYRALRNEGFCRRRSFAGLLAVDEHHSRLGNISGNGSWFKRLVDDSRRDILKKQAKGLQAYSKSVQPICNDLEIPLDIEDFTEWISGEEYLKEFLRNVYRNGQLTLETSSETACGVIEGFSRLVSADKIDAAQYSLPDRRSIPVNAVESYIKQEFGEPESNSINELREHARTEVRAAAHEVDLSNSLLELTLPTGFGKTLTSLDAALILRNRIERANGSRPRIVYTVPYTSIIDQNFTVFETVLANATGEQVDSELLLKHHYLSDSTYMTDDARDPDQDADRAMMLTERWESEFVATTFVQFLESLVVPSNAQSMKIPNLKDAIVLMDEVQAIPARYWDIVREVLDILSDRLNCKFIAMSATQPGLFDNATSLVGNQDGDETNSSSQNQYFKQLDRVTFKFDQSISNDSLSHADLADRISTHAQSNPDEDLLVVCNTIRSATDLFEELKCRLISADTSLVYLSSAVRPKERRQRIKRLRSSEDERFVVVSTQVVEAGVDIDMDAVWRDFAPFDSIVQAAGRCNRDWDSKSNGVVTVVSIANDGDHPAWAIYDDPRLHATHQIITGNANIPYETSEHEVTSVLVDRYFDVVEDVKQTSESLTELRSWQFEDAGISLIEDTLSAEVFVTTDQETKTDGKPPTFTAMQEAVEKGDRAAIARAKPVFYENVVTVNLYSETSDRAADIRSLPLPDTDLGVYFLNADSRRYEKWYDEYTGFSIPDSTVDARLI